MKLAPATRSMIQSTHALDRAQMYHPIYREHDPVAAGQTTVKVNVSNVSARAAQVATSRYGAVLPTTVVNDVFGRPGTWERPLGWSDHGFHQPVELGVSSFQDTAAAASRMVASLKTIDRFGFDRVLEAGGIDRVRGGRATFGREIAAEAKRRVENAIELIDTFDGTTMRSTRQLDFTQAGQGYGLIEAARLTAEMAHITGPARDALWQASGRYLRAIQTTEAPRVFDAAKPDIIAKLRTSAALLAQPAGAETWRAHETVDDVKPARYEPSRAQSA